MMTRQEAIELVKANVTNANLVKHMLAVEAVMGRLAKHLGEDEETWTRAGLLHDLDYDFTAKDPSRHGLLTVEILAAKDIPPGVLYAIKCHANHCEAISTLDRALVATDPLTGLIVAAALMHPTKKLRNVDAAFVLNRFKEKGFARGANRDQIRTCDLIGLELEQFVAIGLEAMTGIDAELGL